MNSERTEEEIKNSTECILKSEDFGIPQTRHRLIIVGIREDIQDPRALSAERENLHCTGCNFRFAKTKKWSFQGKMKLWKEVLVSQIRNI